MTLKLDVQNFKLKGLEILLTLFFVLFCCCMSTAQVLSRGAGVVRQNAAEITIEPEFPGGLNALMKHVAVNTQYPQKSFDAGEEGIVTLQFLIDTNGLVKSPSVLSSAGPFFDSAALSMIGGMPRWTPGRKGNQKIAVLYRLPIHFTIPESVPENKEDIIGEELIYRNVDMMAQYPDGNAQLVKFLKTHIPDLQSQAGEPGANLEFVISSAGKATAVKLVNCSKNTAKLKEKLLEVLPEMELWRPADLAGQQVASYYLLPVNALSN